MIRIPVDFNAETEDGMIRINTDWDKYLLEILQPGLRVVMYTPNDVEVEGVIYYEKDSSGDEWWYGIPEWDTTHYLSPEDDNE